MTKIDSLLSTLNGGMLLVKGDHASLNAYITRIQAESVLDEAEEKSDFSILTPTRCYEFAYHTPGLGIIDLVDEMPHNPDPFHPDYVKYLKPTWVNEWPSRSLPVKGLSIHHTLSHSPHNTARYITDTKGYPRTQYHYWVSQDTDCPVYLCLPESYAPYHDHCGVSPNLSIGVAGSLHLQRPPEEQLWRTVQLVAYLLDKHSLTVDDVAGHNDRAGYPSVTVCPGWYADSIDAPSGVWKRDFCIALQLCLNGGEWGGY